MILFSLMLKLFHHVRDKIKERERDHRRKEKQSLMQLKVDEASRLVDAIDELWIAFLTPPQGRSLRSLISILIDGGGDTRFPKKWVIFFFYVSLGTCDVCLHVCYSPRFLGDFLEIFSHLCGFNTTGKQEYLDIFDGVEWNSRDDPQYKVLVFSFVCLSIFFVICCCPLTV